MPLEPKRGWGFRERRMSTNKACPLNLMAFPRSPGASGNERAEFGFTGGLGKLPDQIGPCKSSTSALAQRDSGNRQSTAGHHYTRAVPQREVFPEAYRRLTPAMENLSTNRCAARRGLHPGDSQIPKRPQDQPGTTTSR